MSALLYWFGFLHVAAYALASFIAASTVFINWAVRRFKLKAEIARALIRIWDERREAKAREAGK